MKFSKFTNSTLVAFRVPHVMRFRLRVMALKSSFLTDSAQHSILHLMELIEGGKWSRVRHLRKRQALLWRNWFLVFQIFFFLLVFFLFLWFVVLFAEQTHFLFIDCSVGFSIRFSEIWYSSAQSAIIRIVYCAKEKK